MTKMVQFIIFITYYRKIPQRVGKKKKKDKENSFTCPKSFHLETQDYEYSA